MRANTKFKRLRLELACQDFTQMELAEFLGLCRSAITSRMCGATPFTLPEMYKIMDELGISHAMLHEYFPPNGMEETPIVLGGNARC